MSLDSGYTLSPMRIEDYDEVSALWRSTPGVGLSSADSRPAIAAYLARNPGASFIARHEGRVIGTILCGNDGRRAYIHHTAVAEAHRRRGVAGALVESALLAQRRQGMEKCHLFIFNENQLGKAFWRGQGFVERQDIGIMSRNM